jgi:hypothetical protein
MVAKAAAPFIGHPPGAAIGGDEADPQPRFGQEVAVFPVACATLVHPARCGAQVFAGGLDPHAIVQPGRSEHSGWTGRQRQGTLPRLVHGALVNPQQADESDRARSNQRR